MLERKSSGKLGDSPSAGHSNSPDLLPPIGLECEKGSACLLRLHTNRTFNDSIHCKCVYADFFNDFLVAGALQEHLSVATGPLPLGFLSICSRSVQSYLDPKSSVCLHLRVPNRPPPRYISPSARCQPSSVDNLIRPSQVKVGRLFYCESL